MRGLVSAIRDGFTERDVSFAGTDIVRVIDGRVVEFWHVEELLQLQAQIPG